MALGILAILISIERIYGTDDIRFEVQRLEKNINLLPEIKKVMRDGQQTER